jgi:hypothetical protein
VSVGIYVREAGMLANGIGQADFILRMVCKAPSDPHESTALTA